jgi:hypothetical protein
MKKLAVFVVCISMVLCGGLAFGQVNNLNEAGSILVFPYVETLGAPTVGYQNTFIKIANRSDDDVTLAYFALNENRGTQDPCDFFKMDGIIELSGKEVFYWDVLRGVTPAAEGASDNFIAPLAGFQGLIFVWAIDGTANQNEIDFDFLIGSAILVDNAGAAAQYNAIPHQGLAVVGDRVLNLDGAEYTMATSRVFFEGFTANAFGLPFNGILAAANLDIDFILSEQPDFDINLDVHNVWEWKFSRHVHFCQFELYNLTDVDIDLTRTALGSNVFQAATTSTDAIWAVFVQDITLAAVGELDWATNVWQDPTRGAAATVVLPPVTQ